MILLSCTYCCFNPLQHDDVGTPYGYCVKREAILKQPTATTCGSQRRRDLPLDMANRAAEAHAVTFSGEGVYSLPDRSNGVAGQRLLDSNVRALDASQVGSTVREWLDGERIDTLAQLKFQVRQLKSVKAEIAFASLSRAYVWNCQRRGGAWTSGLHLAWWTRSWLHHIPEIGLDDLWRVQRTELARQREIAAWSIMMLRCSLLADIAAPEVSGLHELRGLLDEAALASGDFSPHKLSTWLRSSLGPRFDRLMPVGQYRQWVGVVRA